MKKSMSKMILAAVLISNFLGISQVFAQINSHVYAPYAYYQDYEFKTESGEAQGMEITTQYGPDRNGRYQFMVDHGGARVVFVYALTNKGIEELAYFPDGAPTEDLRYHEDAEDLQKSTILPAELRIGGSFSGGYRNEKTLKIVNIHDRMEINGIYYYDVVEVQDTTQADKDITYFYAPGVGMITEVDQQSGQAPVKYLLESTTGPTSKLVQLIKE